MNRTDLDGLVTRTLRRALWPFYWIEKKSYLVGLISSKKLILPDFLCIGVQKSGTTWLYEALKNHPEIFMSQKKELDFFSNKHRFLGYSLSSYSENFRMGIGKLKGESSPYCDLSLAGIQFLKRIIPNAKLVLILRNPVDRLWSAGLMHLVRAQKKDFNKISDTEFIQFLSREEIINQGLYANIITRWRSVFKPSQLLICFYDDLLKDPQQFYSSILQFIGVKDINYPCLPTRINSSAPHVMPKKIKDYFLEFYKPSILELSVEFDKKAHTWIKKG